MLSGGWVREPAFSMVGGGGKKLGWILCEKARAVVHYPLFLTKFGDRGRPINTKKKGIGIISPGQRGKYPRGKLVIESVGILAWKISTPGRPTTNDFAAVEQLWVLKILQSIWDRGNMSSTNRK